MTTSSWSTVAHVRILRAGRASAEAVRNAITRVFEPAEPAGDAAGSGGGAGASPAGPPARAFSVETAGRRFPREPAPLAPAGCGPATVALSGDIDAVDRVAAVLSAAFPTERVAVETVDVVETAEVVKEAAVGLTVHPDVRA